MKRPTQLSPLEQDFLLDWFVYKMPMDQRFNLMQEHPVLYNKLVQQEVMIVKHVNDVAAEKKDQQSHFEIIDMYAGLSS